MVALGKFAFDQLWRILKDRGRRLPSPRPRFAHGLEVEVDSVYADPRKVESPAAAAALLATILDKDEARLASRLASKRHFVWLKRRIGPQVAKKVRALELPGIDLVNQAEPLASFHPSFEGRQHAVRPDRWFRPPPEAQRR